LAKNKVKNSIDHLPLQEVERQSPPSSPKKAFLPPITTKKVQLPLPSSNIDSLSDQVYADWNCSSNVNQRILPEIGSNMVNGGESSYMREFGRKHEDIKGNGQYRRPLPGPNRGGC